MIILIGTYCKLYVEGIWRFLISDKSSLDYDGGFQEYKNHVNVCSLKIKHKASYPIILLSSVYGAKPTLLPTKVYIIIFFSFTRLSRKSYVFRAYLVCMCVSMFVFLTCIFLTYRYLYSNKNPLVNLLISVKRKKTGQMRVGYAHEGFRTIL